MLKCIFITNDIDIAEHCENCKVDIIMIDIERIGKYERQGDVDSVKSDHKLTDIKKIKRVLKNSKIMTRINPYYSGTKKEIDDAIKYGTDIIMLPMFKSKHEVAAVSDIIDGRVEFVPLLETSQAMVRIDDILDISGIDCIHIGLNDLHLSLGLDFMFECISGGIVEYLVKKIKRKNIPYGIGGISRLGTGKLDAELILSEYCRLGSKQVILSRSFHNRAENIQQLKENIDLGLEVQNLKMKYDHIINNKNDRKYEFKNRVNQIVKEEKNV